MSDEEIRKTVDDIISDLCGRSGLDQFENIDEDIQEEIKDTWFNIIKNNLSE